MKKLFFCLFITLIFLPSFVYATAFEGDYPNSYFGYEIAIEYPNETFALSAYYNEMYAEDVVNPIQSLESNVDRNYRISFIYRTIFAYGYADANGVYQGVSGNSLNYTDVRFYEQDVCVSNNNISFYITNGSVEDFASNSHPYTIITDQKCTIWENSARPDGVIGPMYWEWLGDYQGYVVKVFLPIATYRLRSNDVYNAVSRFHVVNNSDHTIYYRFLTSGGLYDHSRAFDYDLTFDQDTKNFDLTYQAVQDGVNVLDSISGLKYQISKNLFNKHGTQYLTGTSTLSILDTGIRATTLNAGTYRTAYIKLGGSELAGKTLTLSANILPSGTNNGRLFLRYGVDNGPIDTISGTNLDNTGKVTFTLPNEFPSYYTTLWLGFYSNLNGNSSVDLYVDYTNLQIEIGSFPTAFCPYGLTLNQSCVNNTLNNSFEWVNGSFVDNVGNFIKLPLSLMSSFINGSSGQCTPLSFTIFNKSVSLPCGDFFWLRNDVSTFRVIWTLLLGGFILFRTMIWCFRVLASVLDPMGNSLSIGLDIYNKRSGS